MFNNKTKMFLLLTLIFIAVIGVSAVSATNINNDTVDTLTGITLTVTKGDGSIVPLQGVNTGGAN